MSCKYTTLGGHEVKDSKRWVFTKILKLVTVGWACLYWCSTPTSSMHEYDQLLVCLTECSLLSFVRLSKLSILHRPSPNMVPLDPTTSNDLLGRTGRRKISSVRQSKESLSDYCMATKGRFLLKTSTTWHHAGLSCTLAINDKQSLWLPACKFWECSTWQYGSMSQNS
jgi:hypothetical protein